ncbi:hypothetical protein IAI58_19230 (plasmid) [Roseomonas marmotae]|uniref:hypothetical protein n=1 Tax=Roseomonas marmotae TaxID=2768161 RepID=UPI001AD6AEDB|nr:hypothetical protein [Roseomonas marmotae]QTI81477.1 hypothetical protein IAI58_19230 [Roseomonas marmotae]
MTLIGVGGLGGLGISLLYRFMVRKMSEESTAQSKTEAERDIIDHMRQEIDRLQEQNTKFLDKITSLQSQIIEVQRENADLRRQISDLKIQVKGASK